MRRVILPFADLSSTQTGGSAPSLGGSGCVTWHSFAETGGTNPATYALYDGPPGGGILLAYVTLSASQSTRDFIGLHALPYVNSLYLDVISGTVTGTIVAWADHVCEDYYRHDWALKLVEGAEALKALGS